MSLCHGTWACGVTRQGQGHIRPWRQLVLGHHLLNSPLAPAPASPPVSPPCHAVGRSVTTGCGWEGAGGSHPHEVWQEPGVRHATSLGKQFPFSSEPPFVSFSISLIPCSVSPRRGQWLWPPAPAAFHGGRRYLMGKFGKLWFTGKGGARWSSEVMLGVGGLVLGLGMPEGACWKWGPSAGASQSSSLPLGGLAGGPQGAVLLVGPPPVRPVSP